jgi:hypothetical protein
MECAGKSGAGIGAKVGGGQIHRQKNRRAGIGIFAKPGRRNSHRQPSSANQATVRPVFILAATSTEIRQPIAR